MFGAYGTDFTRPSANCTPSAKNRLISFVRLRVRQQLLAAGASSGDVEWTDRLLDPNVLTIGFARRFATYKRATLLLRDHDRLEHLLNNAERPVPNVTCPPGTGSRSTRRRFLSMTVSSGSSCPVPSARSLPGGPSGS